MIRYLDYSKNQRSLFEGYKILGAQEVLENFGQDIERLNLFMVEIKNQGDDKVSLTWDFPQLSLIDIQDVDYYEETLIDPQEKEERLSVCFLKQNEAKEFINKVQRQEALFPRYVPQTIIISPE